MKDLSLCYCLFLDGVILYFSEYMLWVSAYASLLDMTLFCFRAYYGFIDDFFYAYLAWVIILEVANGSVGSNGSNRSSFRNGSNGSRVNPSFLT